MILRTRTLIYFVFSIAILSLNVGRLSHAEVNRFPLKVFSDVGYLYDNPSSTDSFRVGGLNLFLSSTIDKKTSFLVELVFQPKVQSVDVDLERTYAQYVIGTWLKVSAGLLHTAFGFWNDTYHHGRYLYTPANRPYMERMEFEGGILPIHTAGVELRGNGLVGHSNLLYALDIGNGRGPVKNPPSMMRSYSRTKAFNLLLAAEFENGLRLGGNAYRSDMPGGYQPASDGTALAGGLAIGPKGTEYIGGLHLVYNSSLFEILNEYARVLHTYSDGNPATHINLLYSQFGVHLASFTPYFRFDWGTLDRPDAYLKAYTGSLNQSLDGHLQYYTLGTRYELSSWSALKAEGTASSDPGAWAGTLNWSFAW